MLEFKFKMSCYCQNLIYSRENICSILFGSNTFLTQNPLGPIYTNVTRISSNPCIPSSASDRIRISIQNASYMSQKKLLYLFCTPQIDDTTILYLQKLKKSFVYFLILHTLMRCHRKKYECKHDSVIQNPQKLVVSDRVTSSRETLPWRLISSFMSVMLLRYVSFKDRTLPSIDLMYFYIQHSINISDHMCCESIQNWIFH